MKQFYTCWVENSNGGYGDKHDTFKSAETEAKRLANLPENVGKQVYVLFCLGAARATTTTWEDAIG